MDFKSHMQYCCKVVYSCRTPEQHKVALEWARNTAKQKQFNRHERNVIFDFFSPGNPGRADVLSFNTISRLLARNGAPQ